MLNLKTPRNDLPAFRIKLEQQITQRMHDAYEMRTAPPEVIHRRVDGREVLNRRFHHAGDPWREPELERRS